jgi:hypothetical protein
LRNAPRLLRVKSRPPPLSMWYLRLGYPVAQLFAQPSIKARGSRQPRHFAGRILHVGLGAAPVVVHVLLRDHWHQRAQLTRLHPADTVLVGGEGRFRRAPHPHPALCLDPRQVFLREGHDRVHRRRRADRALVVMAAAPSGDVLIVAAWIIS